MKIPFDIKFRPQIESGEYQITNSICEPVRVICWDADIISTPSCGKKPIISLQHGMDNHEVVVHHLDNGKVFKSEDTLADLFIVTPEPELTKFEKGIKRGFLCAGLEDVPTGIIKDTAQELMTIAKKELFKEWNEDMKNEYVRGKKDGLTIGYKQAEKDLTLTIDAIERIHTFLYAVKNNKQGVFTFTRLSDEQYEEVLRRFNNRPQT